VPPRRVSSSGFRVSSFEFSNFQNRIIHLCWIKSSSGKCLVWSTKARYLSMSPENYKDIAHLVSVESNFNHF